MLRVLIIGAKGMLGRELQVMFTGQYDVYIDNKSTLDITNKKMVHKRIKEVSPDVVINCAAFTDIDKAEDEIDLSMQVNGYAVEYVARACESFGAKLVQFSTEYVFDGSKRQPYGEDSKKYPQNVYGKSKSLGEDLAINYCSNTYIIRTSWLFGTYGRNFVNRILELSKNNEYIKVINNQIGCPTWTKDLGFEVKQILENGYPPDIYHITNDGETTWYDLAKEIFKYKDININIIPTPDTDFAQKAKRPSYCVLGNNKIDTLRPWDEAIKEYLGVF